MDEEMKQIAIFISWMVSLFFVVGFGVTACISTFNPDEPRFKRDHEYRLMKACVDNKMEWRDSNCVKE
jgi:hypothetical protein